MCFPAGCGAARLQGSRRETHHLVFIPAKKCVRFTFHSLLVFPLTRPDVEMSLSRLPLPRGPFLPRCPRCPRCFRVFLQLRPAGFRGAPSVYEAARGDYCRILAATPPVAGEMPFQWDKCCEKFTSRVLKSSRVSLGVWDPGPRTVGWSTAG